MHHLLRAVGTSYKIMPDILRTYGTLNTMYLIFYPYTIPNWMILNENTQFLKMSMNNAGAKIAKKFLSLHGNTK